MTDNQLLRFRKVIRSNSQTSNKKIDRHTKKMFLYLFTSTRGGFTRMRIIMTLLDKPRNTHQISQILDLDYKAIQHHMKVLEKNNMVFKVGKKYGAMFHLSLFLETNINVLDEAIDKLERKMNHKIVYL